MTTQERAPLLDRERLAELLARGIDDEVAASAWRLIAEARRILLLAHEHPDPDALGSALGLAHALRPARQGVRCRLRRSGSRELHLPAGT